MTIHKGKAFLFQWSEGGPVVIGALHFNLALHKFKQWARLPDGAIPEEVTDDEIESWITSVNVVADEIAV